MTKKGVARIRIERASNYRQLGLTDSGLWGKELKEFRTKQWGTWTIDLTLIQHHQKSTNELK